MNPAVTKKKMVDSRDLICIKCGHTCARHYRAGDDLRAPYQCIDCDCVIAYKGAFKVREGLPPIKKAESQ